MLEIDKMSRVPIYEQVIQKLELLILTNVLGPNSPLPSGALSFPGAVCES